MLPARALRQIAAELAGYSLVQMDVATGTRSRRDGRIEELLQKLTGAEAATVVNNNAAATAIVLSTVAAGKEVIVSRGQLVEIGGSFRLPDVMAAAGARLVEVGTTNKTHLRDYERAITADTAAILRVHPSNYKIVGFTAEVPLEDLVRLGPSARAGHRRRRCRGLDRHGAVRLREGADPARVARRWGRPGHVEHRQDDRRAAGRHHSRPRGLDRSDPEEPAGAHRPRG